MNKYITWKPLYRLRKRIELVKSVSIHIADLFTKYIIYLYQSHSLSVASQKEVYCLGSIVIIPKKSSTPLKASQRNKLLSTVLYESTLSFTEMIHCPVVEMIHCPVVNIGCAIAPMAPFCDRWYRNESAQGRISALQLSIIVTSIPQNMLKIKVYWSKCQIFVCPFKFIAWNILLCHLYSYIAENFNDLSYSDVWRQVFTRCPTTDKFLFLFSASKQQNNLKKEMNFILSPRTSTSLWFC